MGKVWVQAVGKIYYEKNGKQEIAEPGDWAEIGKHQARQELARGTAIIPDPHRRIEAQDLDRCGVVVRADIMPSAKVFGTIQHTLGSPSLPFDYTVLWKPSLSVTSQGLEAGLARLRSHEIADRETWEILATLVSEETMASDVGSPEEQRKTKKAVGDLRLPVYDTRLLWIRKTANTEDLIERWTVELATSADEQHSFLRALYGSKVMMLTLPPGWHDRQTRWTP